MKDSSIDLMYRQCVINHINDNPEGYSSNSDNSYDYDGSKDSDQYRDVNDKDD
jgi:hypothetical protein